MKAGSPMSHPVLPMDRLVNLLTFDLRSLITVYSLFDFLCA
jgi:hypothetical protein